ncbi:MAG TPA: hypothetical protein VLS89_20230 [Candidatus Nanopelagicales bacterium]|nr:hypothetical protein [Candidatus Nanopelagicales bacterium]
MLSLLPHVTFTLNQLRESPYGAAHVGLFEGLKAEGRQVLLVELDHAEAKAAAQARVVAVDVRLDGFADRFSKQLLTVCGNKRDGELYTHFFPVPLNELTRPVLNDQLVEMKRWQKSLETTPYAALAAMKPELDALIAEGKAALDAREDANQGNREFRDVGARKLWVDSVNAARKETHGALAKLPHEHPHLPSNFADRFFLSERNGEAEDEGDSLEALEAQAASLREALAQVEGRVAELKSAEEAARAKKAAEVRKAREAALAELDRTTAELSAKRAAIVAELNELSE